MEKVYIVSRCIQKNSDRIFEFNFKGFYKGLKVKEIRTRGASFDVNEDYLVLLSEIKVHDRVLYGRVLKSKKLFCNWELSINIYWNTVANHEITNFK